MATDQLTPTRPAGTATAQKTPRWRLDARYQPVLGTVVVLAVMLAVGGSRYENFLTGRVMANILINNSFLVVLAVGMTFVILTGGIDLSVGAVVALSGCISAWMFTHGWSAGITIPVCVLVGTLIGLIVGVMVHVFEIQPFIATLAAMFLARGLCYLVAPESIPITDPTIVKLSQTRWGTDDGLVITPSGVIALAVVAVAFVVLHYTRFGRTVYAIGGSEQSARLMGLPVARTKVLVYVISGTCAGLGGLLFAIFSRSGYSLTGVGMELDAIAAVVIGGTLLTGGSGFVLGSVLGVVVLGLIQTIITFQGTLSSWWTKIVIGALLLVFVVLQRLLVLRRR
ncbi:galactofuranose ABC transporter, permease protein YjfF [Cellulomonas sp.]|uniref:galactofuranose ABC transporter, permease protein YjfF n=1 Tax=Cellulomonas sp. TaxID=40001 RepID=UPI001B2123F2|nr:galactofuranose ABC transporter, permease protein YjfF [Cellulomonas sp.]MBO9555426.1 sugar ABC transporter permease YjfF [Cellulomonas sp.]